MRLALAFGASVVAAVGTAYLLNKYHDKLPDMVVADDWKGHAIYAAIVALPTLAAFAVVGGAKGSGPLPLPPTKA